MKLLQKHRGDYNELFATIWLLKDGYEVFRNVSSRGPVDLVGIKDGKTFLFDVKAAEYALDGSMLRRALTEEQVNLGVQCLHVFPDGKCWVDQNPRLANQLVTSKCIECGTDIHHTPARVRKFCSNEQCRNQYHFRKRTAGIARTAVIAVFLLLSAPVRYFDPALAEVASPANPSPAPSLTVREALSLAVALRNLDGHLVIVSQDGGKSSGTVMVPWEFGNGALRLRIARDLGAVAAVERTAEESRQAIIREILKKDGGTEIRSGTPAYDDFTKQYEQVLSAPMPDPGHLDRIKASELKLDRNEIPVTVLTALGPILDRDQ